jgi:hypothetical protein
MVTMVLRVFNAWTWFGILISTASVFHAWGEPARLLGEVLIAAVPGGPAPKDLGAGYPYVPVWRRR